MHTAAHEPGSQSVGTVVSLATIAQHSMWTGEAGLDLTADSESARRLWSAVLLMAERESAVAVRYRPWRSPHLALVVGDMEYEINPRPATLANHLIAGARRWAAG